MAEPLFRVGNQHGASSGAPPAIDGDTPGRYCGYFGNEYGEQAVFVYDYAAGTGTLWMGDTGWDRPLEVEDGAVPELVLNEPEALWLRACWLAATAGSQA